MDYQVEHPDFQGRGLSVRTGGFFGGALLVLDGGLVEGKRGKFSVRDNEGRPRVIKFKVNGIDPIPKLNIDGDIISLARSLAWYEYTWMGLPIILVFSGGALGALCGMLGTYTSARIFRSDRSNGSKFALSGLISLGAVALFFAGAIALQLVISWNTDISSKQALLEVARATNKDLPLMVDDQTELFKLDALEGVLVYHYRLAKVPPGQISAEVIVEQLRPTVTSNTCAAKETRDRFLENGVVLRYVYNDSMNGKIGEFDVVAADCR